MDFRILICSQDAQLFLLLQHLLAVEGFSSSLAGSAGGNEAALCDGAFNAIVFDSFASRRTFIALKARYPRARTIWLQNRPFPPAMTFETAQADLVLTRPFDPSRLVHFLRSLRAEATVGWQSGQGGGSILYFADLELNTTTMKVRRGGRVVSVTGLQFRLLRQLLLDRSGVQTRENLISACWPAKADVEPRTVDIHIGHLRRALNRFGPDLIRTVRTVGYVLDIKASEV